MKHLTLNEYTATHLYELAHNNFLKKCTDCEQLKERLEKFIGDKQVRAIKRILKKNPYGSLPNNK